MLTFALSGLSSSAQEVKEFGKMLAAMKASTDVAVSSQASKLESLVYELHPSVNIQERIVSTFAEAPFICVDIDAQSVSKLKDVNPLFSHAELLTIRINNQNDLNMALDLASLKGFSNLKYINFICSFECSPEQVSKLIKTSDTKIIVSYLVSVPS